MDGNPFAVAMRVRHHEPRNRDSCIGIWRHSADLLGLAMSPIEIWLSDIDLQWRCATFSGYRHVYLVLLQVVKFASAF